MGRPYSKGSRRGGKSLKHERRVKSDMVKDKNGNLLTKDDEIKKDEVNLLRKSLIDLHQVRG